MCTGAHIRMLCLIKLFNLSGKRVKLIVILLSIFFYLLSFTQDAIIFDDYDGIKTRTSLEMLLMGSIAVLGGGFLEWIVWLANPIFIIALFIYAKSKKGSVLFSLLASLISLSFIYWHEILAAENGRLAQISSLEIGYWFWLSAMIILTSGVLYDKFVLDN
jgi:hypothetical protein